MAIAIAGGAAAAGSVLSSLIGGGASKSAAKTQSAAAQQAMALQASMFNQIGGWLAPFRTAGTSAMGQLAGLLGLPGYTASGAGGLGTGALVQPFQPTMAQLAQTPGYQFTRQQGLEAVQNQAAAQGQGGGVMPGGGITVSGPEGRGMTNYAEGLASTTFQQQFQNYWNQLNNIYSMISGTATTGANAAAMTGQAGQTATTGMANALQAGAAAQASGQIGAASAIGQGISGLGSIPSNLLMLQAFNKMANPVVSQGTVGAVGGGTSLGFGLPAPPPVSDPNFG